MSLYSISCRITSSTIMTITAALKEAHKAGKAKREAKAALKAQRLENLRLARVAKGIGKK